MFELVSRIFVAGLWSAAGLMGWRGASAPLASLGLAVAAYSILLFLLERRGLRSVGVTTFFAGADSAAICFALGYSGALESFGFLCLAPTAWAAHRFGAPGLVLAPIAAGSLVASSTLTSNPGELGWRIGLQAVAILIIGSILNPKSEVVLVPEPVLPVRNDEPTEGSLAEDLELRETYRRLRESFQHLERQSARDRRMLRIRECAGLSGKRLFEGMVSALMEESKAEGVCLFLFDPVSNVLAAHTWRGAVPARIAEASLSLDSKKAAKRIAIDLSERIGLSTELRLAVTVLRASGRIIGAVAATHASSESLDDSLATLEELAPIAAEVLAESQTAESAARRAREAELLYEISTGLSGAKSAATLAARTVQELYDSRQLDSAAVWLLDGENPSLLALSGAPTRFFESLSFANGPGVAGWVSIGAPDIGVVDAFEDSRCGPKIARQEGVGSFALCAIRVGTEPFAFIAVSTQRIGGVDSESFDAMRRIGDELAHRLAKLEDLDVAEGLAVAEEMREAIRNGAQGCLVYLEPQRRTHWEELVGKPSFEAAIREFGRRMRPRLPSGSLAVRREQGDYVALLRDVDVEFAESWANEAAALASFVGIRVPGESRRAPFGVRAKVAQLRPQNSGILEPSA